MNQPWVRVILFILVFGCVTMVPWWLSAMVLVGLTVYFPYYLEVLFFGFLFDRLYAGSLTFPHTGLILAFLFLLGTMFIRTRIRT